MELRDLCFEIEKIVKDADVAVDDGKEKISAEFVIKGGEILEGFRRLERRRQELAKLFLQSQTLLDAAVVAFNIRNFDAVIANLEAALQLLNQVADTNRT